MGLVYYITSIYTYVYIYIYIYIYREREREREREIDIIKYTSMRTCIHTHT